MFWTVTGLALLDGFNPLTIMVVVYLLATQRPLPRTLAYLAGVALAYLVAGVALVRGWGAVIEHAPAVATWMVVTAEALAAVALLTIALRRWSRRNEVRASRLPEVLDPRATFLFALVSTPAYVSFGPSYHLAAARIASGADGFVAEALWLLWFNAVYLVPVAALVVAHLVLGARTHALFAWYRGALEWGARVVLPYALALGALVLIYDAARRLT